MSLPLDLLRKLTLQTTITTAITAAVNAIPGGKYVLIGAGVLATAAGVAYAFGGRLWRWWFSGTKPTPVTVLPKISATTTAAPAPAPATQRATPPTQTYTQVNNQLKDNPPKPPAVTVVCPSKAEECEKQIPIFTQLEMDLRPAWKKLKDEHDSFKKAFGEASYSLPDEDFAAMQIKFETFQELYPALSHSLKLIAQYYKNGDAAGKREYEEYLPEGGFEINCQKSVAGGLAFFAECQKRAERINNEFSNRQSEIVSPKLGV